MLIPVFDLLTDSLFFYVECFSKFADNIGLKFYTPEEFFDGTETAPYFYGNFNPKNLSIDGIISDPLANDNLAFYFSSTQVLFTFQQFYSHRKIHRLFPNHLIQN
jgi:hypothetical protein